MSAVQAQKAKSYQTKKGQTHLIGTVNVEDFENENYKEWFDKGYAMNFDQLNGSLVKKGLKNVEVEIYFGSWCGDSREWLPQFIKLWDEAGLKREQLKLMALYGGGKRHKTGPNGEEIGKKVFRVPTFIFKKEEIEIARIVESPATDLVTDVSQIALGFPSRSNYPAAQYLLDSLGVIGIDAFNEDFKTHLRAVSHLSGKSAVLNSLGYLLLNADRIKEALVVFRMNTYLHKYLPNVYDSYGEALALDDQIDEAIKNYEKVLLLDSENENAIAQLKILNAGRIGDS